MDEVEVKTKKIEIEVNQEKIYYINYAYNKEIACWKKAALEREWRKRVDGFSAFKNFVEIQAPWKHAFFVCMKIVFHIPEPRSYYWTKYPYLFQLSAIIPEPRPYHWTKYPCLFQLSGIIPEPRPYYWTKYPCLFHLSEALAKIIITN